MDVGPQKPNESSFSLPFHPRDIGFQRIEKQKTCPLLLAVEVEQLARAAARRVLSIIKKSNRRLV